MSELLKCPFCGGEAILDREDIFCDNCYLSMRIDSRLSNGEAETYEEARQQAIETWNTRAPMANIVEKLEELKNEDVCMETSCTECKEKYKNNYKKDCYEPMQKLVLDKAINIVKQEINNEN